MPLFSFLQSSVRDKSLSDFHGSTRVQQILPVMWTELQTLKACCGICTNVLAPQTCRFHSNRPFFSNINLTQRTTCSLAPWYIPPTNRWHNEGILWLQLGRDIRSSTNRQVVGLMPGCFSLQFLRALGKMLNPKLLSDVFMSVYVCYIESTLV